MLPKKIYIGALFKQKKNRITKGKKKTCAANFYREPHSFVCLDYHHEEEEEEAYLFSSFKGRLSPQSQSTLACSTI